MSADAFANGVATLLATDVTLQTELALLLGASVTRVIRGNVPVQSIPSDQWPCWIVEHANGKAESITQGGGDADGLVIGGSRQSFASELDIALLWNEADRDRAFAQRGRLPTLLAQLLLRNPSPGGTSLAFLRSWQPDQAIHHPQHLWQCVLQGEYVIRRQ